MMAKGSTLDVFEPGRRQPLATFTEQQLAGVLLSTEGEGAQIAAGDVAIAFLDVSVPLRGRLPQRLVHRWQGQRGGALRQRRGSSRRHARPYRRKRPHGAAAALRHRTAAGNYVVQALEDGHFALYAHLQPGSIEVQPGQSVEPGQVLGLVGNSGNSVVMPVPPPQARAGHLPSDLDLIAFP